MRHVVIVVFLVTTSFLAAQEPVLRADAKPSAESEIKALELVLADLVVRGEWDDYAKHLAPDYLHTRDSGQVEGKDETLASLRDVKRKIIFVEAEPADFTIHSYGDFAVSNAQVTVTVRDSGQVKTRVSRRTQVFVKRDGQWLLVAGQETAIGK
jgi:uncharacterized protein (TIGR02246 family)